MEKFYLPKTDKLTVYLKNARIKSGLSQWNVAEALGYGSAQFVSNWERGKAMPPWKTIRTIARLYNLDKRKFMSLVHEEIHKVLKEELN